MPSLARELIEQGLITVQSVLEQQSYIIRLLDKSDLMAVIQLQSSMLAVMEKKELCVPIPMEELQLMLEGNGESLGLFIKNKLYASCSLLFPVDYKDNMARQLNFGAEELPLVAQLELSLVDRALRGQKLQQKLAGILAQRVAQQKKARYLFTTVSPYNYPSIQTVTALGLQIVKLCKMYHDWDRYIVYKDFINPTKLDMANAISLPNTAFAEQRRLLNNGYRGFSQFKDKDSIKIMFAKELET